ncbi:tetratricopeptide repeat protein [Lutimaribacter sp. EGI FJ00015]|uniref:Tetratricopeptide repeat protein n=1 Tax=Lutimaribacter degradans TaxID=2945989 RepID=A0ACC5ZTN5_9RHOB|nr:tetratricopeptide repeat protein [Lutimaribacter sp. EGI FJ00013]MCM2561200.1 tetratricopeptide repeat protein [Lutimaribacter sp. EGI FJ00013]MCO0611851.1 tetratricopeptide repeat protein [Lutimaribacter sp. EGI FJ00015]MCO0635028.1 tetratricopeptide repeat protein [Lutimaribacter sp. EGI FJ00014]
MHKDPYGNPLHTQSAQAADAYNEALVLYLDALPGAEAALDRALAADPGFALAWVLKARNAQVFARMDEALASIERARATGQGLPAQAAAHLAIFDNLLSGRVAKGYKAARAYLLDYPRDPLVAQSCLGVFSLIGFSGAPGREAEHLAMAEQLAPAYGQDGWFLGQLAFARIEVGQLNEAEPVIEAAMAQRPRSGHGAHVRAHLFYEAGQTRAGRDYLSGWMADYDRSGLMHGHNAWHIALWSLAAGDVEGMWAVADRDLAPARDEVPPLNLMTDLAALLWRAEMAGVAVCPERWAQVSDYAARCFPDPALGFADIHAALAHAMAGREAPLHRIIEGAKGPAADLVAPCARAFHAMAVQDWAGAEAAIVPVLYDHARLGGSRAQRDMLDYTLLTALIRQGKGAEAQRLLALRRPLTDTGRAVAGL